MKLHEYQSKQLFAEHGIPIPHGQMTMNASEAKSIAEELGGRVVVKSQVLVGGRGKAGGIRLVNTPEEAEEIATQILGMKIKDLPVRKVLIDEAVDIKTEIYLGITNDRTRRCPVMIASAEGGVEIEEVAKTHPDKIVRVWIDPLLGLRDYQARYLAACTEMPREHWREFMSITKGLYQTFMQSDATLAEINPLVITGDKRLMALDGKMVLDDNGLFRHPELAEMRDLDEEAAEEREARKYGLSYVKLGGEIGCMVNGAVLFNIFGGITRGDEVARGILAALEKTPTKLPMVVRLVGNNAEEGRHLLAKADMETAVSLADAAQKAIAAAKAVEES